MLICGGGTINWTFLQQGAVDELSLHMFSELCPDAEIAEGLTANDLNDIEPWVQGLGLIP